MWGDKVIATDAYPHDLDAEKAVLGSILVRPTAFDEVSSVLVAGDFYRLPHALVFGVMSELRKHPDATVDFVTIKNVLEREGHIDDVGIAYLSSLADGVPRSSNALGYARVVADHADRRRLIDVCRSGIDQSSQASSAEDVATALVDEVKQAVRVRSGVGATLGATLAEVMEALDNPVSAVTTGIPSLDALGCGHRPGELCLVAGRPSHGKTSFALHLAKAAATDGVPVWFASLEMSKEALSLRLLSSDSGLSFSALRSGSVSPDQYKDIAKSLQRLSALPITIDDHGGIGVGDLRRAMIGSEGILIVDYLQLVRPPTGTRGQNRVHEVGAISRALKAIAQDCKVTVIALSQLNRQADQQLVPSLSQLRDSGELEQDCDVCLLISRPSLMQDDQLPDRCVVRVAKHRNGPLGSVELVFDGARQSFRERQPGDPQPAHESQDSTKMQNW